jgi:hypothetical protein
VTEELSRRGFIGTAVGVTPVLLGFTPAMGLSFVADVAAARPDVGVLLAGAWQPPGGFVLGDCARLEAELAQIASELRDLGANSKQFGMLMADEAGKLQQQLKASVRKLEDAAHDAEIDQQFAVANAALAVVVASLAVACTGPVAIGVLGAVQILSTPAVLGWASYVRKDGTSPDLVIGYARDRTLLVGELAASGSKHAAAGIARKLVLPVGLMLSAWDYHKGQANEAEARRQLGEVNGQLKDLDKLVAGLRADPNAWAGAYREILEGTQAGLKRYIEATRGSECRMPPGSIRRIPSGPVIRPS